MTKLKALNLSELESLYYLIDEGIYDGYSTSEIRTKARIIEVGDYPNGNQNGIQMWIEMLNDRKKLLEEIEVVIRNKINALLIE
jgi:hypothetical protein